MLNPLYYIGYILCEKTRHELLPVEVARIPIINYPLPIKVYLVFSVCTFFSLSMRIEKKEKMESPLVIRIDKNEFKPGRSITQDGGAGEIFDTL